MHSSLYASLGWIVIMSAALFAVTGIWAEDPRWLYTSLVAVLVALVLSVAASS